MLDVQDSLDGAGELLAGAEYYHAAFYDHNQKFVNERSAIVGLTTARRYIGPSSLARFFGGAGAVAAASSFPCPV
jgi:hypothetical protein